MTRSWAYGVTTVPARFDTTLPRTLQSLANAGFDRPRLFVDGATSHELLQSYEHVVHNVPLRTYGNWWTAAVELYIRSPHADRFAIFQDDVVTVRGLRAYLDTIEMSSSYLNLFTMPKNEPTSFGFHRARECGKGALGLVFTNDVLRLLLRQSHFVNRPACRQLSPKVDAKRSWKYLDGAIHAALRKQKVFEHVHSPSLLKHTGDRSSMTNGRHPNATSFPGESFDARAYIGKGNEVRQRIGLVGFNTRSGLGVLNRQLATHVDVDLWLVKPHKQFKTIDPHPDVDTMHCRNGARLRDFLKRVDVVLFAEQPYYSQLLPLCRRMRKRTVCVPMVEWMPAACRGWPQSVDHFICPTRQSYRAFSHLLPCTLFSWPVDVDAFEYRQRQTCERFVFVNGTGGWDGRKGGKVVVRALQQWPDMPLTIYSQRGKARRSGVQWPDNADVRSEVPSNADLYREGDVLVIPHSCDGIGLELGEAMASGMPVISTNGTPWDELPAIRRIAADVRKRVVQRPVPWHFPDPANLVEHCRELLGTSIADESEAAHKWATDNAWSVHADQFSRLVRSNQ